ncbi:MAG: response regulator [Caulobacteraceae bacterium]|nr:response regulator [Caulobacteraceae bacterium]
MHGAEHAAAAIIRDATPDLAITDLQLPGLGDAAIVALLRTRLPATPIVAVSGAGPEVLARARAAGADASVAKPFDWETLESAIAVVLRR